MCGCERNKSWGIYMYAANLTSDCTIYCSSHKKMWKEIVVDLPGAAPTSCLSRVAHAMRPERNSHFRRCFRRGSILCMFEIILFLLFFAAFYWGNFALKPELDLDATGDKLRPNFASHTAAPVSWQAYRGWVASKLLGPKMRMRGGNWSHRSWMCISCTSYVMRQAFIAVSNSHSFNGRGGWERWWNCETEWQSEARVSPCAW